MKSNFLKKIVLLGLLLGFLLLALTACFNQAEHMGPESGSSSAAEASIPVKIHANEARIYSGEESTEGEVAVDEDASPEEDAAEAVENQADSEASGNDDSGSSASGGQGRSAANDSGGTGNTNSAGSGSSSNSSSQRSGSSSSSNSGGGSAQGSNQSSSQGSGSGGSGQTQPNESSQSTTPRTISVSIEIEARTAHREDPAAVAGISNAGVILSRRNLTLPEGSTVRQALDASGVRVNARGAYIAGIAGLSEGDLGPRSGWMYSVNGEFPNTSASAFRLSAGDSIVWRYTIDGGADLGARW